MGSLFGGKQKVQPAVRMPDSEDADSRAAALRKQQAIQARGGRQSTLLTRRSGGAGTTAYGNSLLGQG